MICSAQSFVCATVQTRESEWVSSPGVKDGSDHRRQLTVLLFLFGEAEVGFTWKKDTVYNDHLTVVHTVYNSGGREVTANQPN